MSPMERAESAMRANFELLVRLWRVSARNCRAEVDALWRLQDKLGVDYWCFHDRDIAPEARGAADTRSRLCVASLCRARHGSET